MGTCSKSFSLKLNIQTIQTGDLVSSHNHDVSTKKILVIVYMGRQSLVIMDRQSLTAFGRYLLQLWTTIRTDTSDNYG